MTSFDLNRGAIAPVSAEVTLDRAAISVDGQIPSDLNGVLLRNGPNPRSGQFEGDSMLDWWVGDGMLHGLAIEDGEVAWYRNRWQNPDGVAGSPKRNVNVIGFGGTVLALGEGEIPLEVTPRLETVGAMRFAMAAHPKIDPGTGMLRFLRADWQPPFLQVGAIDTNHRLVDLREVPVERPVMMHDFAITPRFDVLLHLNVILDPQLLESGVRLPLRWDPDHRTRIAVVPRGGSASHWFDIAPCFIQHVVNAYEHPDRPDTVVLDAVRYSDFLRFDDAAQRHLPNPLGVLWRYELDTASGSVTERQIDDRHVELPRIDERFTGQANAHVYVVEQPTDQEMRGLRRYDLATGSSIAFPVTTGDQNSEPIFVSDAGDVKNEATQYTTTRINEGDGWLLSCVYRVQSDTTDVVVLRAAEIDQPPIATIHLPCRIPAGFHGAWIPVD